MTSGIRAELSVEDPADCPVASLSRRTGGAGRSISRSLTESGRTTEEFTLDADGAAADEWADTDAEFERVFAYGDADVYRFQRDQGVGCPCERIEQFDCPVVDQRVVDGTLHLAFHAPDLDVLSDAVDHLRERYPDLTLDRLVRTDSPDEQRLVFVDRGKLTTRQREVLETAHEMGYFDQPRQANAGEVADELGISDTTFSEHLGRAQKKLMGAILET